MDWQYKKLIWDVNTLILFSLFLWKWTGSTGNLYELSTYLYYSHFLKEVPSASGLRSWNLQRAFYSPKRIIVTFLMFDSSVQLSYSSKQIIHIWNGIWKNVFSKTYSHSKTYSQ